MDLSAIEGEITEYMKRELLVDFSPDVTADSNLFELGLLDSYGLVELVTYIEAKFGVGFTEEDLLSDSMTTLRGIVSVVMERANERAA